jgi:hypothetical protein
MNKLKCNKFNKKDDSVCSALSGYCSDCFRNNINKIHNEFKESISNIKTNRG